MRRSGIAWIAGAVLAIGGCTETGTGAPAALPEGPPVVVADPPPPRCDGVDADGDGRCDRDTIDWSAEVRLTPGVDRGDLFGLGPALPEVVDEGLVHAQVWPVSVSGTLIPYEALMRVLDPSLDDPLIEALRAGAAAAAGFGTVPELYDWLGAPPYDPPGEGPFAELPYTMPRPARVPADSPMSAAVIDTEWGPAMTFSCTACHAGRLLGRTVIGLANRRSRANQFFDVMKGVLPIISSPVVLERAGITDDELSLVERTLEAADRVDALTPLALGLDTSLAQVALSLALRGDDPYAEPDRARQYAPRPNALATTPADSKSMPWWTLKYKTRWLSDGSVVSGNPVLTNFLWNELGRGTDLYALEGWMRRNGRAIDTLTAAVFASQPPRWTDFFPPETIDLDAARRGQAAFAQRCATCHGTYEKAWDGLDAAALAALDPSERLRTRRVLYHAQTPVIDVGTDPLRAEGMRHLAPQLNALAISQWMQTTIEVTEGYVPPPLDGIWARYPYLHNNSVPTLCALLSPPNERPARFYQGPSEDAATDFDADCVGYPVGEAMPAEWAEDEDALIDTTVLGLSNQGHALMLDGTDGNPPITPDERADLVMFLKTL